MAKLIRLDKYLANLSIGSRSEVKKYINKGLVKVDNQIIKDVGYKVNLDKDKVYFDQTFFQTNISMPRAWEGSEKVKPLKNYAI